MNSRTAAGVVVEVDRVAPFVLVAGGEIRPGELREVVAVRTEMVVDDVQNHAQAEVMRAIDEPTQVVRGAVQMARREQIDAVVAPAETSGELRDRHHFDRGDPDVGERRQLLHRRTPGAFLGERADVELVEHLAFEAHAGPRLIGPCKRVRIDHLRRAVRTERLGARSGIGKTRRTGVEPIAVQRARADRGDERGKVAVSFCSERRLRRSPRRTRLRSTSVTDAMFSGPDAKVRAAGSCSSTPTGNRRDSWTSSGVVVTARPVAQLIPAECSLLFRSPGCALVHSVHLCCP